MRFRFATIIIVSLHFLTLFYKLFFPYFLYKKIWIFLILLWMDKFTKTYDERDHKIF